MKIKISRIAFGSFALLLLPSIAFAQNFTYLEAFIRELQNIIEASVPVVIGIAVLLFLFGLARYILNQDSADIRTASRKLMIWGVVIIFVMVSFWGFVAILDAMFLGGQNTGAPSGDIDRLIPS